MSPSSNWEVAVSLILSSSLRGSSILRHLCQATEPLPCAGKIALAMSAPTKVLALGEGAQARSWTWPVYPSASPDPARMAYCSKVRGLHDPLRSLRLSANNFPADVLPVTTWEMLHQPRCSDYLCHCKQPSRGVQRVQGWPELNLAHSLARSTPSATFAQLDAFCEEPSCSAGPPDRAVSVQSGTAAHHVSSGCEDVTTSVTGTCCAGRDIRTLARTLVLLARFFFCCLASLESPASLPS